MIRNWTRVVLRLGTLLLCLSIPGLEPARAASAIKNATTFRPIQVGKGRTLTLPSEAAALARDGDVVEIDGGDYWADAAVWTQKKLTLRGVNGRVRLFAGGASAEGKAIWVLRDGDFLVENIEFVGARVADRNGAGIRFERGHLTVRNCVFRDNETGLLTSNDRQAELEIENSEFGPNGFRDGSYHHNLYVGQIARLSVRGSYFHHATEGHLFKSRARENHIFYNRFTDEVGGASSYELEIAEGGLAYVVGNVLQQSVTSENPHILSYGTEGYTWPRNELYLSHNTFVDDKPRNGVFLRLKPGAHKVRAVNNLLIGKGRLEDAGPGDYRGNEHGEWSDVVLVQRHDYHLRRQSRLVGIARDPGSAGDISLRPEAEYHHPRDVLSLPAGTPLSPGAMQIVAP